MQVSLEDTLEKQEFIFLNVGLFYTKLPKP